MGELSYYLTLNEVTRSVHLTVDTVVTIVEHGIVEPSGDAPEEWRFEPEMVATLQRASRLRRDLELDWEAIALAVSLIDQVVELRRDNRRLRQQLNCMIAADSDS